MLDHDPSNRSTLNELVNSDWVTDSGKEKVDLTKVNIEEKDDEKAVQFGNIKRLVSMK